MIIFSRFELTKIKVVHMHTFLSTAMSSPLGLYIT